MKYYCFGGTGIPKEEQWGFDAGGQPGQNLGVLVPRDIHSETGNRSLELAHHSSPPCRADTCGSWLRGMAYWGSAMSVDGGCIQRFDYGQFSTGEEPEFLAKTSL